MKLIFKWDILQTYTQYLELHAGISLLQIRPHPDLNVAADTGNTALHAAANNGNVILVTALLKAERIDLNPRNPQCENATPLHLAVMHGETIQAYITLYTWFPGSGILKKSMQFYIEILDLDIYEFLYLKYYNL